MTEMKNARADEHRRRWMRGNAHLWIRPDAYRFMAPGAPRYLGKEAVRYFWPEAQVDQRAPAADYKSRSAPSPTPASEASRADLDRELASLRWHAAAMRVELMLIKLVQLHRKAGFDPDQPRVPAGNPDGGQWTRVGGGGGRNDPRIISDVTPDDEAVAGAQYAQGTSRYSVDLLEEELAGGHTYKEHVGKSDGYLLARARATQLRAKVDYESTRTLPQEGIRAGSFPSLQAANNLVNSTLARNQAGVDLVASGGARAAALRASFDSITGKEAYAPSLYTAPVMRETYGVKVFIMNDPTSPRGYRVHTAYPTRF